MELKENLKVGEIVAQDYRTASVFKSHKIDFCCRGGRTVSEVCQLKEISTEEILDELKNATISREEAATDYASWPLDLLVDYIEKKHHRYITQKSPELAQYLNKLCRVHGERHPELFQIRDEFVAAAEELASHMQKEEMILFPFIRQLSSGNGISRPAFGTVEHPIQAMMHEHTVEGDRFERIAQLSDQYNAPADGCTTYRVAFAMLKEFEDDLHLHIHIENNILFPGAMKLEKKLVA